MRRLLSAMPNRMREDLAALRAMFDPAATSATDFETFRRDLALVSLRLILVGAATSILFFLPTDFFIYNADISLLWMVLTFRIGFVALAALMYFAASRVTREYALGTVAAFTVILVSYAFTVMGFIASPTVPFAFTSFFVPSVTVAFPYSFRERCFAALLASGLALAGYYTPHPEYLSVNYTGMIFIFLTFTTFSAVGFGHMLFTFQRAMFDQRLQAQQQARELAEANRVKDTFVATVSHELRTPMNAILGLTDAILDEREVHTIHRYGKTIRQSGDLLLSLINDILDLAKIRAGRLELNPQPTAIGEVVERAASIFMVQCRAKGLKLALEMPESLPTVAMDPLRLQQILTNLLGNAVKFTERGEVGIRVALDSSQVPAVLRIDVWDTGPGVPADKREAVFQEFVQVESSGKRQVGTGLGLPIVRRLARHMGGDVTLADNPSGGAIFSVTLPVTLAVQEIPEGPASIAPRAAIADVWFLICAPEPARRMALWELLAGQGRQGGAVTSLEAAAEQVRQLREMDRHIAGVFVDDPTLSPDQLRRSPLIGENGTLRAPVVILRDAIVESEQTAFDALRVAGVIGKPVQPRDVEAFFQKASAEPEGPPGVATPSLARQRVLVVDDVAENRLVIEVFLRKTGCQLTFATDGLEGAEVFRQGRFDLVFLDIEMPRMDGYEALREMRRWESERGQPRTRIIALTAHATAEHQRRIQEAGFSGHLTKPIRRPELNGVLAEVAATPVERQGNPFVRPAPQLVPDEEFDDPEIGALRDGYLRDKQESLATLQGLMAEQRFPELASMGHRWQGSGSSYGYPQISALGARIEEAARHRDAAALHQAIAEAVALLSGAAENGVDRATG